MPHQGHFGICCPKQGCADWRCSASDISRLHRAKGWASHPPDFFCKYQLHTGRGEQCLDITQEFLFTTRHPCTPESIWRSALSCCWSWSHKQKVRVNRWHPNSSQHIQHQHPPPALQGPSWGQDRPTLMPGHLLPVPHRCPKINTCLIHAQVIQVSLQALHPATVKDLKSFNKPYFSFFKKKVKQGFEEKNNKGKVFVKKLSLIWFFCLIVTLSHYHCCWEHAQLSTSIYLNISFPNFYFF